MIKAVLLDLDDTLLHTNTDVFVQQYITLMVEQALLRFPQQTDQALRQALRGAVRAAIDQLDPTTSNAQRAANAFTALTGIDADEWRELQEGIHLSAYLALGALTNQEPSARPLVDCLQAMGLAVVVATNPIFSESAIRGRLGWAGLADLDFALVTHTGNMHFAKPHPHYYEEILARVGVEPDEAIMVGDHPQFDMQAAHQAGLNTFWIDLGRPPEDAIWVDGRGTLADFAALVADGGLGRLTPVPHSVAQVAPRLIGNVGAVYGLVDTIKPAYWHMRPDPAEWSPLEVLIHLRDSERHVQRPRLQRIAVEDNPFIAPPRTPPGPGGIALDGEDGPAVLRQFWEERCGTLAFLDSLATPDWARPARHSVFGPTSLLEMAFFTTRHDHLHINQLCQTLGRCAHV
jgi:HAD superfamily hydrolase (TIGR01509 family)